MSAVPVTLRPATTADLPSLVRWNREPHVIAATGDDRSAADQERDWLGEWFPPLHGWIELLIAEVDGRPVGVMECVDPAEDETHYWGPMPSGLRAIDIWIGDEADLGKGYGHAMMQQMLERCFAAPEVVAVLVDPLVSNTRVHRFYERLGFAELERRTFNEGDHCVVYRLERDAWRGQLTSQRGITAALSSP